MASDFDAAARGCSQATPHVREHLDRISGFWDVTITPDGLYHCNMEVVALVYDSEGRVAVAHTDILRGNIPAARFATIAHGGFPIHQEISVPAHGAYTLRTGIRDVRSNHIGALELPIASVRNLPPAAPSATVPATSPRN